MAMADPTAAAAVRVGDRERRAARPASADVNVAGGRVWTVPVAHAPGVHHTEASRRDPRNQRATRAVDARERLPRGVRRRSADAGPVRGFAVDLLWRRH
jgi:hypothetical protein